MRETKDGESRPADTSALADHDFEFSHLLKVIQGGPVDTTSPYSSLASNYDLHVAVDNYFTCLVIDLTHTSIVSPLICEKSAPNRGMGSLTTDWLKSVKSRQPVVYPEKFCTARGSRIYSTNALLCVQMTELGYDTTLLLGICGGLTALTGDAFITGNLQSVYNTLRFLLCMTPDQVLQCVQTIDKHIDSLIQREIDNASDRIQSEVLRDALTVCRSTKHNILGFYDSLSAHGDGAAILCNPEWLSTATEHASTFVDTLHASQDQAAWAAYLKKLSRTVKYNLHLRIRFHRHEVCILFDSTKQQWLCIDANDLPGRLFCAGETERLAAALFESIQIFSTTTQKKPEITTRFYTQSQHVMSLRHDLLMTDDAIQDTSAYYKCGGSLLERAIEHSDPSRVVALAQASGDINARDFNLNPPLYLACKLGKTTAVAALLRAGADINIRSINGSPLYAACYHGHTDIICWLADAGADINAQFSNGMTPLYLATYKNHIEAVNTLLALGADPLIRCRNGALPREMASHRRYESIISLLAQAPESIRKPDTPRP